MKRRAPIEPGLGQAIYDVFRVELRQPIEGEGRARSSAAARAYCPRRCSMPAESAMCPEKSRNPAATATETQGLMSVSGIFTIGALTLACLCNNHLIKVACHFVAHILLNSRCLFPSMQFGKAGSLQLARRRRTC